MPPEERARRFDALFGTTHRHVLAYALRRTREPADAEDVAAETFAVAWRRLETVPDGDLALPWLYAVARRVLANHRRGGDRRTRLLGRLFDRSPRIAPAPTPDVDDGPAFAALARLRPDDQELLRLVAWEELSHAQIGVALGVTVNAVAIRLHRARARFAAAFAAVGDMPDDDLKGIDPMRTSIPVQGGAGSRPGQERTR